MNNSNKTSKPVAFVVSAFKVLLLALLMLSNINTMEAFSQTPITKKVWVLFPMAREAQEITVTVESDNTMTYQEDILIDPSQIVTNPEGTGARPVDLVLKFRQLLNKRASETGRAIPLSAGGATWAPLRWGRWPDAVVPYKIDPDMPQDKRDLIAQAIEHINRKTNLCFRKREAGEDDYVEYTPVRNVAFHGQSAIGKVGGKQKIKLSIDADSSASFKTVVHESLHAVGFIHEHCRSDRDDFVKINTDNIISGMEGNFDKDLFSENYTRYDFKSVMHYNSTAFGIEQSDGTKATTIKTLHSGDKIEPSRTLTNLDIEGVNATYPDEPSCSERTKIFKVSNINADGSLGSDSPPETVSGGWSDAEPIVVNGIVSHMMLLNTQSDFARVRPIANDGVLDTVNRAVYNKGWTFGWRDLEMYYADNTTYILHHKRVPLMNVGFGEVVDPLGDEQGLTRISKVNKDAPFADGDLGEKVYEDTWGKGWTAIKFFSVGSSPFIFRYNRETGSAQTFQINSQEPFAHTSLGDPKYDETWTKNWDIIRFFKVNGKTYSFLLKIPSGKVKIHEMTNQGRFGAVKFEADWRSGWDNVDFFTHPNGRTYFITLKSSTGEVDYHRFKLGDPFSFASPYEVILESTWTKGWTHTKFYDSPDGYKLLLMKR